jgi:hypothetical protein
MYKNRRIGGCLVVAILLGGGGAARAGLILETADLGGGPPGLIGIGFIQWLGARFSIDQPTQVDHVGGPLAGAGDLFAAIVPLDGPGGLPSGPPLDIESYALAATTFAAPATAADVLAPLPVTLAPGDYGLVLGVGFFGGNGAANMTTGNVETAQASYFRAANVITPEGWFDGGSSLTGLRFLVTGTVVATVVPEPTTLAGGLLGVALAGGGWWLRRRRA